MASPATVLTNAILARHGARPDLRLFRQETGVFWAGRPMGTTVKGYMMLEHASRVSAGLCKGSSDLIGILKGSGRFIALEVKAEGDRARPEQTQFIDFVLLFGGIAGFVRSVGDVDQLLGVPPGKEPL